MKMSKIAQLVLAAATGLALVAGAQAQSKPNPKWPSNLTLGTASVGGTYFVYGQVWASLVNEKLGTNISTQQTQGPNQNIILSNDRKIDFGMATMGVALQAWNGAGAWTQGKKFNNIRAMFPMYDTPFHFITLEKSGIKSVQDLKGKTVGVGPRAGTCGTYFPLIFKALGVNVTVRNGQASDMSAALQDGQIDAFPFCAGVPTRSSTSMLPVSGAAQFMHSDASEFLPSSTAI